MSRIFSESELALLRRQFLSEAFGQSLSEETADALLNAAEANNKAVAALAEAQAALAAAQAAMETALAAATPDGVQAALAGYATEDHVASEIAGLASEAYVDGKFAAGANFASGSLTGKLVTIVDGLITEVVDE